MNFSKQNNKKHWAQRAIPKLPQQERKSKTDHMQSCVDLDDIGLLNSSTQSWKTTEQYLQSSEGKFFQPNTLYPTELLNKQ